MKASGVPEALVRSGPVCKRLPKPRCPSCGGRCQAPQFSDGGARICLGGVGSAARLGRCVWALAAVLESGTLGLGIWAGGGGAWPDAFLASSRLESVRLLGSAPPGFGQEEASDAPEEIPAGPVSKRRVPGCLQNRKRPFQERQPQEAAPGTSRKDGLSAASGQVVHPLLPWAWPGRSPEALFVPKWRELLPIIVTQVPPARLCDLGSA